MHRQHVMHLGVMEAEQQEDRLLAAFDEICQVVGEHVADDDGISECAISPGSSRRRRASTPPVVRAASQNVPPTTAANTNSPAVRSSVAVAGEGVWASTKPRQPGVAEKLSNAVEPNSGARTPRVPARTGSVGRWSNGFPVAMRPSRLRRSGDGREATTLYTSNGSARAHQRSPQHSAPAIVTAK